MPDSSSGTGHLTPQLARAWVGVSHDEKLRVSYPAFWFEHAKQAEYLLWLFLNGQVVDDKGETYDLALRLHPSQVAEVKGAFATIFEVLKRAKLVESPIAKAKTDQAFQAFITRALVAPVQRPSRAKRLRNR